MTNESIKRPHIGIIIGSIRDSRKGGDVGKWVFGQASQRDDARFTLIDLQGYELPLLTDPTPPGGANRKYDSDARTRWGRDIDACDGFIFVTAEYNHGVPGAFKNAYDSIGPEWQSKPVGFVSYGSVSGIRAVEQWRQIVATFSMIDVSAQVSMSIFDEFGESGEFTPIGRRAKQLSGVIDELLTHLI